MAIDLFSEEYGEIFFIHHNIICDPKQTQIRIDKFLMDKIPNVTRNRLQTAIERGFVKVDGELIKANYKVRPNNVVTVSLPKNPELGGEVEPQEMPLDIRYEDEDLMIIYKPAGLVCHPGVGNHNGTLVNGLVHYLQSKNLPIREGNLEDRPGLVHRIDKDTSGLLVVAKTEIAMTGLSEQFMAHTIERKYQAIVWGQPDPEAGTIDMNIGRDPNDHLSIIAFPDRDLGKHAITHYKVLEGMYYVSLIECQLETGRTHQIRVHMKQLGHPLFNDEKYKGDNIIKGTVHAKYRQFVHNTFKVCPRQALHAKVLGFKHPRTGEYMRFETELPEDMKLCLDRWRHYVTHKKDIDLDA